FDSLWLANRQDFDVDKRSLLGVSTSTVLFNFLLGIIYSMVIGLSHSILHEHRPSVGSRLYQIPGIILDCVEIFAESIFVAALTPILTFTPFILADIVVPSFIKQSEELSTTLTAFTFALWVAALAAVIADPIFRRGINPVVSAKKKREDFMALFFSSNNVLGGDRDVVLLVIPYLLLTFQAGANFHGLLVDWQMTKRFFIFGWIVSAYILFGYFNLCGILTLSGKPEENITFNIPLRRSSGRARDPPDTDRALKEQRTQRRSHKSAKKRDDDEVSVSSPLLSRKSPSMEIMELSMSPARS
ncbi:MAG: hypothetical protein VXZ58_06245, partial [Actinomycetota bacterium]|nr:hypothetical protein [Actinomycetota bacterium]